MMLFLFVLMLVGVDASDSLVETLRGQRLLRRDRRPAASALPLVARRRPGLASAPSSGSTTANEDGNVPGDRPAALHQLRLRLRGHLRAADHRGARRDGARPPRAAHPEADPGATWPRSGCATTPTTACTSARCPRPASSPGTTRSTPRRCCPTARPSEPSISRVLRGARHRSTATPRQRRPQVERGRRQRRDRRRRRDDSDGGRRADEPRRRSSSSRRCCSPSARSACWSAATRSWCSCASS